MKTQKELKAEYKTKKFKIGVFQIRNLVNNKIYVDGSLNLDSIWNRNRLELNFGSHRNKELQKEWKTLGEDKFAYEILSEIDQKEGEEKDYSLEVKLLTEMFIEELSPFGDRGYHKMKNTLK